MVKHPFLLSELALPFLTSCLWAEFPCLALPFLDLPLDTESRVRVEWSDWSGSECADTTVMYIYTNVVPC